MKLLGSTKSKIKKMKVVKMYITYKLLKWFQYIVMLLIIIL